MATGAKRIFTLAAGIVAAGVMNPATSTAHLPKEVEQETINSPDATLTNFGSALVGSSEQSFVIEIVKRIVDAKAQFRSLAEPWADTGTSTGRLMLAVLGGLADVERDLIRTRTAEGRARQGPRKGRGPSPFPHPVAEEGGHQAARAGRYAR